MLGCEGGTSWIGSSAHRRHPGIRNDPQVIERHEAAGGGRGRDAGLLGFPTAGARRRNEAKARVLLACWMADTGQGYRGDIESASCVIPLVQYQSKFPQDSN